MNQSYKKIANALLRNNGIFLLVVFLGSTFLAKAIDVVIPCGTTTVNLNTYINSTPPLGSTITWHTSSNATLSNKITNPLAAGVGEYYAAFENTSTMTYSTSIDTVNVLKTVCLQCTVSTFNLATLSTTSGATGTTLTWHTSTPATDDNKVTNPTMVPVGIYYPAFYHSTDMCYSPTGKGVAVISEVCLPPVANNIQSTPINSSSGPAPINDFVAADPDGTIATYTIESLPPSNQGVLLLDGVPVTEGQVLTPEEMSRLTFDPEPDFEGNVVIEYSAQDNDGNDSNIASINIPIVNEPPVAQNILTNPIDNELGASPIPPLQGSDPDGVIENYTIESLPMASEGVLYLNGVPVTIGQMLTPAEAAMLSFDPAPGFVGFADFTYTATDNSGNVSAPATYTIPVVDDTTVPNEIPPLSNNITVTSMSSDDGAMPLPPLNSVDVDGTIVSYTITSIPPASEGVLYLNGIPVLAGQVLTPADIANLTFDPNPDFFGEVQFTYTATDDDGLVSNEATVTIPVENIPPIAQPVTANEMLNTDGATPIPSLNASDSDGTIENYTITSIPPSSEGVLYLNGVPVTVGQQLTPEEAAQLTFDPAPGFVGEVEFTYTATDNTGQVSSPAIYTIPVVAESQFIGEAPIAEPVITQSYPNTSGVTSLLPLDAYDPDGIIVSYTINSIPPASEGVLLLNGVPVTVGQVLTPEEAAQLTFDPALGFVGDVIFNYSATDNSGNLSNVTTYTIPITGTPPVTQNITAPSMSSNNGPTTLPPLVATDVDGTVVNYTITSLPPAESGTLLLNGVPVTEGQELTPAQISQLQFDPNPDWNAPFTTFTYIATDNNGNISNTSTVTIPMTETVSLPVQLLSFAGRASNCKVHLTWKTASEVNFSHFDLQRKVGSGNYVKIETIQASGSNSTYSYDDASTNKNVSYRLKLVDNDGSEEFSNIVFIEDACTTRFAGQVIVYPNPSTVNASVNVEYTSESKLENANLVLHDMRGRIVFSNNVTIEKGTTFITIQTPFAQGMYMLSIVNSSNENLFTPIKLVVTK